MASLIFKMPACRLQNRSNRENKKSSGCIAQRYITPSFIEIAPAVTKRALLTDNDRRHVIAMLKKCHGG
jgi:hypothetical protein